ncbi:SH3 domain-containing protein [Patescibacteria group bacterium]|nr:SH3 domain-containing protein [Patescibacteria group bacterium]
MNTKTSIAAMLSLLFLALPNSNAFASDCYQDPIYQHTWTGEISTGAFVRNNACMEGTDILTTLPVGTIINVTGETDGWYRVQTNEIDEGWIGQWLVSVTDTNGFANLNQNQSQTQTQTQSRNKYQILERTRGYILLQVENHGEAWYVDPTSDNRYYMKDGPTAYEMMRKFGLGISDADLLRLQSGDTELRERLKGRILLQVQQHGEAYYVHPQTGEAHYMANGEQAYELMRYYSLGITNLDLEEIDAEDFIAL